MRLEDFLEEYNYEDVIVFKNLDYDTAFLGVSEDNRSVYDYELMVEYAMKELDCTDIEAREFIDYNTIRSLPYVEGAPIILYRLKEEYEYMKREGDKNVSED